MTTHKDSNSSDTSINDVTIYPGLVLKDDYILLYKIGNGNNASVWMIYKISTDEFQVIKIVDPKCLFDGKREVVIMQRIRQYEEQHKTTTGCIQMLDHFVYIDEEDNYICSVYDLCAGSLQMLTKSGIYKYGLPIPVVKTITRKLLTTLAILHDELEIIHTDIKLDNILIKGVLGVHLYIMDVFRASLFREKYQQLVANCKNKQKFQFELDKLAMRCVREICDIGNEVFNNEEQIIPDDVDEDSVIEDDDDGSERENVNKFNNRRQSIDDVIEYLDYSRIHDLEVDGEYDFTSVLNNRANSTDKVAVIDDMYVYDCETVLIDFGNAYFFKKRTRDEIQDRRYRAPEVILDLNYGYECDIWSVGCVVFELLTGFVLFDPEVAPLTADIHQLFLIEKMLGTIPLHMKQKSKRKKFLFDASRDYHIKNVESFDICSISQRLVTQFLFSEEEASEISSFLLCVLEIDPYKRSCAKEMLKHPWLN